MISLELLPNGEESVILEIVSGFGLKKRICCMNIREGKIIKKISSQPFRGPIIINIDGRQCAIGREMAKKIMVKEK
jgi:ferrous iron transport protein A